MPSDSSSGRTRPVPPEGDLQADVNLALSGAFLFGDDFTPTQVAQWFADEEFGYYDLYGGGKESTESYGAEVLARIHSYHWLPPDTHIDILGIGCADGAELEPLASRARSITVLEPAEGFHRSSIGGRPATYLKPSASGTLQFPDESFDLIVCFSVLHHIPNVSDVIAEMSRVLRGGGYALLREPIVSMGDWRLPRPGLTKRERGIPLPIFRAILSKAGFGTVKETLCMFSAASRIQRLTGLRLWKSSVVVNFDKFVCAMPWWSKRYHTQTFWDRFRPTAVSYVLMKGLADSTKDKTTRGVR